MSTSGALITKEELDACQAGDDVWIPSADASWKRGVVVSVSATHAEIEPSGVRNAARESHPLSSVHLVNPPALTTSGVEDMERLSYLHEPALLANVRTRFEADEIYTYTGDILIASNPYRALPIYGEDAVARYHRAGLVRDAAPHIYAVAETAYRGMLRDGVGQALIISGESGAGKTETTKLALRYLTKVAGVVPDATVAAGGADVGTQILEANPLLEAFGNAKTLRNDNSSRFGKFIAIQFDGAGRIGGATVTNYLLEKSRIVSQADGERNYHIFYQLCRGASAEERAAHKIGDVSHYRYLTQSTCSTVDGVDDAEEYRCTVDAMRCVGFTESDVSQVMRLVSAVLTLGNVDFAPSLNDAARVADDATLATAAELLGVDPAKFRDALTTRIVRVPGEGEITTPLTVPQAAYTRDAIAKEVYNRMFNQLVRRVNQTIEFARPAHTIGVLDIFGFEIFEHNAFEQFCINYANEKLQSQFNDHVFEGEIREYEKEGIPFDASGVTYVDNGPCVDLIEGKLGVIALLDEECSLGQSGEDAKFLHKLLRERAKSEHLSKPRLNQLGFTVAHYAGDVTYTCSEFLDKNMDTLRDDVVAVLAGAAGSELTSFLFSESGDGAVGRGSVSSVATSATSGRKKKKGGIGVTVASQFRGQLADLVSTLSASQPHYVRCLKSNSLKKPRVFESPSVLHQLRCAGVLESIRIRRSGYPSRSTHEEFFKRYRILGPTVRVPPLRGAPAAEWSRASRELVGKIGLDEDLARLGSSKVFLRMGLSATLERMKAERLYHDAVRVQSAWRRYSARSRYLALRAATIRVQSVARGAAARREFRALVAILEERRAEARRAAEAARLERERLERERLERERLEQERLERERVERERLEQERLERERVERERLERERVERERREKELEEQRREERERRRMAEAEADTRRRYAEIDEARRLAEVAEERRLKGIELAREQMERERMRAEEVEQRWVETERARIALEREHIDRARWISADAAEAAAERSGRVRRAREREVASMRIEEQRAADLVEARAALVHRNRVDRVLQLRKIKKRALARGLLGRGISGGRVGGDDDDVDGDDSGDDSGDDDDDDGRRDRGRASNDSNNAGRAGGRYVRGGHRRRDPVTFDRRCRRVRDSVALLRARRARTDVERRLREIHDRSIAMLADGELERRDVSIDGAARGSDVRRAVLLGAVSPARARVARAIRDNELRAPSPSTGAPRRAAAAAQEPFWDSEDPLAYRFATGTAPKCLVRARRKQALDAQPSASGPDSPDGSPVRATVNLTSLGLGGGDAAERAADPYGFRSGNAGSVSPGGRNGETVLHPLNDVSITRDTLYASPLEPLHGARRREYHAHREQTDLRSRSAIVFDPAERGRRRVPAEDPSYLRAKENADLAVRRNEGQAAAFGTTDSSSWAHFRGGGTSLLSSLSGDVGSAPKSSPFLSRAGTGARTASMGSGSDFYGAISLDDRHSILRARAARGGGR